MPYKKTTWKNHETKLNETNLNNMEEGIATANQKAEANEDNITEIRNASQKVSVSFDNANKDLVIKVGDDSTPNVKSEHRTNIPVMSQDELNETLAEHTEGLKEYIASKVTGIYKSIGSVQTKDELPKIDKKYSLIGDSTKMAKRQNTAHQLSVSDRTINIYANNYYKGQVQYTSPSLTNRNLPTENLNNSLNVGEKIFIVAKIENIPETLDINTLSLSAPGVLGGLLATTYKYEDKYLISSATKMAANMSFNIPNLSIKCTREITDEEFASMDISVAIFLAKDLEVDSCDEVYDEYLGYMDVYSEKFFNGEYFYYNEIDREYLESIQIGDTLNVVETNMNYTWNGEEWDPLGSEPIQILSTMYSNINKDNLPPDGLYLSKETVYIYYGNNSFNSCRANSLLFVKGKIINTLDINNGSFIHFYISDNGYYYEYYFSNIPVINEYGSDTNDIYVPTNPGKKGQVLVSVKEDDGWECEPEWKDIEDILPEGTGGSEGTTPAQEYNKYVNSIEIDDIYINYDRTWIREIIEHQCWLDGTEKKEMKIKIRDENKKYNSVKKDHSSLFDYRNFFGINIRNTTLEELQSLTKQLYNADEDGLGEYTLDDEFLHYNCPEDLKIVIKSKPISKETINFIKAPKDVNKRSIYLVLNHPTRRRANSKWAGYSSNMHGDGYKTHPSEVDENPLSAIEIKPENIKSDDGKTFYLKVVIHGADLFNELLGCDVFEYYYNLYEVYRTLQTFFEAYEMQAIPTITRIKNCGMGSPFEDMDPRYISNGKYYHTRDYTTIQPLVNRAEQPNPRYYSSGCFTSYADEAFYLSHKYFRTNSEVIFKSQPFNIWSEKYLCYKRIHDSQNGSYSIAKNRSKFLNTAICSPQFVTTRNDHIVHKFSKIDRNICIRLFNPFGELSNNKTVIPYEVVITEPKAK